MSRVLIITGPTASGKTAFSESLAALVPSEIINADVGQFYTPLSVGTAKPDVSSLFYPAHGFNSIDQPRDVSVVAYRNFVGDLVDQIKKRDRLPMLVGGSLFYLKSLFFPPIEPPACEPPAQEPPSIRFATQNTQGERARERTHLDGQAQPWDYLHEIDPERAAQIHPNDGYRIARALDIWYATGVKPSAYKPVFNSPFNAHIIFVCPERSELNENIKKRVRIMMEQGWVEETEKLIGTEWEDFLQKKGLIGYPELIDWIKLGKHADTFEAVVKQIELGTIAYAKRQVTFWKSFSQQLEGEQACSVQTVSRVDASLLFKLEKTCYK